MDRLSSLPDFILILILSSLPFKDALKTSLLSKRWENLHRETTNISFKDTEFVTGNDDDDAETVRAAFMLYVTDWVSRFAGPVIETFELCFVRPVGYETQVKSVIELVVSKKVKNLVLDFSDPQWLINSDAEALEASMIRVPESFYSLTTLESLKLSFCGFDPSKLESPGSLRSLCIGWIELKQIMSLILKTPLLENLRIKYCWNVGLEAITGASNLLYKLVLKDCEFKVVCTILDLPNIQIFKYSGTLHPFVFVRMNKIMEEVLLDFWEQLEHDEDTGTQLRGFLYNLVSARTLTLCPFLIQMIQDTADPIRLQAPMEAQQLVLSTSFQGNEFVGIKLMINSCPNLEILTFQVVRAAPLTLVAQLDPDTYWTVETNHRCLKKTLKAIEVWNFSGGTYELHVLRFLIRYGLVLERVDLYLPCGVDLENENENEVAIAAAETMGTFQVGSRHLKIYVHSG